MPKITITKKTDFCNYYENDEEDNDKWKVYGELVPFLIPLKMRRGLTMIERILYLWEWRDMLNSNINLGCLLHFEMARSMQ